MKPVHRQLIQNALYVPEKDLYLKSTHVHDYVSIQLDDGTEVCTDGGTFYLHRTVHRDGRVVEWDLYEDDPFERVAERLLWGTYGKPAKLPMRHRPIASFDLDHLQAILKTQSHVKGTLHQKVVYYWWATKTGLSWDGAHHRFVELTREWEKELT